MLHKKCLACGEIVSVNDRINGEPRLALHVSKKRNEIYCKGSTRRIKLTEEEWEKLRRERLDDIT